MLILSSDIGLMTFVDGWKDVRSCVIHDGRLVEGAEEQRRWSSGDVVIK
jgi:hypothetical protein